ncbi:GntR family transcriptional regulator [Amycolatopsis jiangsuensis]|uniref:DNA-binding GntR family transcriptional regulator n=1 Tax=Amycolatopsis jiangsuensis TaxID=1181879 RepID=A0A840IVH3_9PSEU|nr:GntR family transcriptional regulator [Amycolatopsis jiangsuensis]MBB4685763.1 DNA-binding GntR family transcriptional regulator [Amycolatopsis jiangsuensis]
MPDILGVVAGTPHIPALLLVGEDEEGLGRTSRAYRAIRRQIIDLTLPPGSSFTEASLARQWDISKTPVREALARLRRDGLVSALPRAGYVVSPITLQDTDDLCALRSMLSSEAAGAAARAGCPAPALDRLEELSKVPLALSTGEVGQEEGLRAGIEFEGIIAAFSGNHRLGKAVVDAIDELERVLRLAALIDPSIASPPGELAAIADRLRARDTGGAHHAMRERCDRVRRDVLRVLAKSTSVSQVHIQPPAPAPAKQPPNAAPRATAAARPKPRGA